MQDGLWSSKEILNGELATGTRPTGLPALWYKNICKGDLNSCNMYPADLETASSNRSSWRVNVKPSVKQAEEKRQIHRKKGRAENYRYYNLSLLPEWYPRLTTLAASATGDVAPAFAYLFSHNLRYSPTNE
jgi:hypothetical protein